LCARSGEKALAQSSPCTSAKGIQSRQGAQARIAWRKAPRDAVDVTCKRNGGEHAWSFLRISRVFNISSTKRGCPNCLGCEQPAAKRDGRPKKADGRGAFRCGHFLRSILALAETRGRTRGNFRAPDARQNSRADHGRPDPRRCRAVVSRRSARSQLTRQPSDGGRDFRFTPNNGHETCQPNWSAKCQQQTNAR
jgi:hypothetical protein